MDLYPKPASVTLDASIKFKEWVENINHIGAVTTNKTFGITGNDKDETEKFKLLFANGGKIIFFENNLTCNVYDTLHIPDNTIIYCNNLVLNMYLTGNVEGLTIGSNVIILGKLTINVFEVTAATGSGNYQCPLVIGNYSSGHGENNIYIENISVSSEREDSNGIVITGDSHNIHIKNFTYIGTGTSKMTRGITIHWGGAAVPTSGTYHPYNILLENIKVSNLYKIDYYPACAAIFVSAGYNVKVRNLQTDGCYHSYIYFAGDYGNKYAFDNQKDFVGFGCSVENIIATNAYRVIKVDGKPGKEGDILKAPVYFKNCKGKGAGLSSDTESNTGIIIANCDGVTINNCEMEGFYYHGLSSGEGVKNLHIIGGAYYKNGYAGLALGHSVSPPDGILIDGVKSYNNQLVATSTNYRAGIGFGNGNNIKVINCLLGQPTNETQLWGIRASETVTNLTLENNHCYGVSTGGAAYSIGSLTAYEILKTFQNNTVESGVTLTSGTNIFTTYTNSDGTRVAKGAAPPSYGSWAKGDRVENNSPNASGYIGWVCVTAGTPGTWKGYGTIEA